MNAKQLFFLAVAFIGMVAAEAGTVEESQPYHFEYLQDGDKAPRAVQIFDDGQVTYFQFSGGKIPAIFATECNRSVLLNPTKNGSYVVVPGVYKFLQSRLGLETTDIKYIGKTDVRNNYCRDIGVTASGPAVVYSEVLPTWMNGSTKPRLGDSNNPTRIEATDASNAKNGNPNKTIPTVVLVSANPDIKYAGDQSSPVTSLKDLLLSWLAKPAKAQPTPVPLNQALPMEFLVQGTTAAIAPAIDQNATITWEGGLSRAHVLHDALKKIGAQADVTEHGQLKISKLLLQPVRWVLHGGHRIDADLAEWAKSDGQHFEWNLDTAWVIPTDTSIDAVSSKEAITKVVEALYASGKPIKLRIYGNNFMEVIGNVPH